MKDIQSQYGDYMVCSETGLVIPKREDLNLQWRMDLRKRAIDNEKLRDDLRQACTNSIYFWLNAFGWTFLQKKVSEDGIERPVDSELSHCPFITWKIQDELLTEILRCIKEGESILVNKSRDMGASWLCVAVFQWFWQFHPNRTFLELSRKQVLVDRRGDMDSLFEKHRYFLKWQPGWLRPKNIRDNICHLENIDLGSTIEGESTNEHAGQAGRKTAILLDEFSRVKNAEEIDLATNDTSACRIFNATPNGPSTHHSRLYKQRRAFIFTMPWVAHPDKGRNATLADDKQRAQEWAPPGKVWTSPWREEELKKRSRKNVAQNIDIDHGRSGDSFFDVNEVEEHRKLYEKEPLFTGNILFDEEDLTPDQIAALLRGCDPDKLTFTRASYVRPWHLWSNFIKGRFDQTKSYTIGIDVSAGVGSSNSVISVLCIETNQIVAKFWDAYTKPEKLAEIAAMAGIWIGGTNGRPIIIWENNGSVGGIFSDKILAIGYQPIYIDKTDKLTYTKHTKRPGWNSNPARKERLLGLYRDALKAHTVINPCREALDECLDYVYDSVGRLVPGESKSEGQSGGEKLHGDHVIADALLCLGRMDVPRVNAIKPVVPGHSFAGRRKTHWARSKDKSAWQR